MMRSGAFIKGAGPFFSGREPHVPAIQSYPTPKQIYLHVTPPTGNSEEAILVLLEQELQSDAARHNNLLLETMQQDDLPQGTTPATRGRRDLA